MPTKAEEALQEAERRIADARLFHVAMLNLYGLGLDALPESIGQLTQLQHLDLSDNQLTVLPESLGQLAQLHTLDLSGNQLAALPASIGQLAQLHTLGLHRNQLTVLPEWLGRLAQLHTLHINSNRLTVLPESIGQLSQLQQLNLFDNCLTVLPSSIGQLAQLQHLFLDRNRLTVLPESLGQLAQLQTLSLADNSLTLLQESIGQLAQLQTLSLNRNGLTSLPVSLWQLSQLQQLNLSGNPGLGLPPEVLAPTWVQTRDGSPKLAGPKAILAYYFDSRGTDSRAMNEAKLLLVGQGRVGKTSLVRCLIHEQKCDERELPTEGIRREPWCVGVVPSAGTSEVEVTLNVWDFGGQEIMHATHQFFLTKRSLYLLVLDAGTSEAENNLAYWLKVIRSFGGDAPVLVVVNKSEGTFPLSLNESRLRVDYPNIRGFYYVSCRTGANIAALQKAIAEQVRELPHVFDALPGPFFAVKSQIEGWVGKKSFITLAEYQAVCAQHSLTDPEAQNRLLRFLHDLGVALNFDDPDDPYELGETNVLDPEWVTDAVYRVLTSDKLQEQKGRLTRADLPAILTDRTRFPESTHEFVLELMRKFELCFDLSESSGEQFLVPERLPKDEPNVGWVPEENESALSFQVRYNVLPPGLVCRFIVKMHTHLTFPQAGRAIAATYWRDGCVLHVHGNRCLVRGSVEERRVFVQVHGAVGTRREALALVRERLGDIHRTIKELKADEFVPVPGQPGVAVAHAALVKNARAGIDRFIPDGSEDPIEVLELLTRIDTDARRAASGASVKPGLGKRLSATASSREKVMSDTLGGATGRGGLGPVDFGIITMKEEEYRAVERRFAPVELVSGTSRHYLLSRVPTPGGEKTVLIARCLEQGMNAAQQCANELLADASPRWLLLVGIAGAFPASEFTLGDVLLASRLHDFSVTAALEGGDTEFAGKGGPVHRAVAKLLSVLPAEAAKARLGEWNGPAMISMPKPRQKVPAKLDDPAFYGDEKWRKKVQAGLKANFPSKDAPRAPLYRVEGVVSGNALVKDPELVKQWKQSARQSAHVEMELGGVYEAAQGRDVPVLSVRGISDVVGFVRSSAWTEFACETAAAFARALVGSGLVELN